MTQAQLCFPIPWALELAAAARLSAKRTASPASSPDGNSTPGRGRQCSTFVRARTVNLNRISIRVRQAAYTRPLWRWDVDVAALRPKTRADCFEGPRPCPFIGCRYHTAIVVDPDRESIKEVFPDLNILADPEGPGLAELERRIGTCALDIADKHDDGTQGIGGLVALYQVASSGKPIGQTPGMTIEEVGKVLNISVERTRQIASQANQTVRIKVRRFG